MFDNSNVFDLEPGSYVIRSLISSEMIEFRLGFDVSDPFIWFKGWTSPWFFTTVLNVGLNPSFIYI